MKVVMGMIVKNRFNELKRNLYHNSQFFDQVVVVSDSSEPEMNEWLVGEEAKRLGIQAVLDFDGYQTIRLRNRYLEAVEKIGWMLRLDVDEFISLEAGYRLPQLAQEAEAKGINNIGFKVCDIIENLDGTVRIANPDFWCPNFFKLTPQITYVGEHHEGVNLGIPTRQANVPFEYYHIRSEASIQLRGARNAFSIYKTASGVGDFSVWQDFRNKCSAEGIEEFSLMEKHMRGGSVPEIIAEWIQEQRDSENSEFRNMFAAYYILFHPELNPGLTNRDFPEFDSQRKPYTREMSF